MAADRGRGAEAGAGRAVALTGRYSFDSGNGFDCAAEYTPSVISRAATLVKGRTIDGSPPHRRNVLVLGEMHKCLEI